MTLTLRIENFRVLDDGGPVSVRVTERGLQAGRREAMDWVLPDASRHISGHHFDIVYDEGDWWLRDVSTNGTFLQGNRHRLDGMHRLTHGDRFQVGHYIIVAVLEDSGDDGFLPDSLPEYPLGQPLQEPGGDDPWSIGGVHVAPIDPVAPMSTPDRGPDFSQDFVPFPAPAPLPVVPVTAPRNVQLPLSPMAPAGPGGGAQSGADSRAFLQAFCDGAGLSPATMPDISPEELGLALGRSMRSVTRNLMTALRERSDARHFTRTGERTMRSVSDNNPLKFLPDAEQAMDALFLNPRAGFLAGVDGLDEALSDLRRHQSALFAALQPALIELLEDLDPARIEAETKVGITGNRKARSWEGYVQRWDAKTASENGILDEFIRLFAAAYRRADEQGRP